MFQLQGVVFIAVLCAVSAAVTVNIYEDENVGVKVHEVESCIDASCDRTCRLLGFTSGICVGDTCECMKQKKDEEIQQNDISSLDEDIRGNGLSGCDPNACYQLCRRLKFPSGTCVNGRCKCDNFRRESELLEQNDIPSMDEGGSDIGFSGCDPNACYQLCRRLKFPSGTCVNGRCKCDNFRQESELLEQNDIPSLDEDIRGNGLSGCDPNACYQLCRRLKFPSGTCVNGRCKCDNFRRESELLEKNDIPSLDEDIRGNGLSGCDPNACYQLCRRLKFPSGTCVNGRCKCDNFRQESELLEKNDIPSLDEDIRGNELSGCDPNACYQLCRRLKFPSGTCVNGRCKCDNFRQESELLEKNDIPSLGEDIRGNGLSGCDPNACYQLCRRLKFPSGTCVNGRCKCDNFRRKPDFGIFRDQSVKEIVGNLIESNYVDKVVTMAVQNCDQLACMMGCQELGFPGGSCFLGKCRCNKRGKEEEIIRSLKSCNSVTCNLMCLRLKYHGGWCRFDTCECF